MNADALVLRKPGLHGLQRYTTTASAYVVRSRVDTNGFPETKPISAEGIASIVPLRDLSPHNPLVSQPAIGVPAGLTGDGFSVGIELYREETIRSDQGV